MADTIQALDRALELLIYLNKKGKEVGITQIASDMGVYKSTIYRTLSTLEAKGFVKRNPETEKYWLGSQLFILGKSVENKMGIPEVIRPYAHRLHQKFHEVVNVSILEYNPGDVYHSVIILKEMNDRQMLTVNPPVGSLSECHCSSVGKCLLAFGDKVDLSVYEGKVLTRYTPNTITSLDELKEELVKVKRRGYAMDHEEQELGLTCIGAPILDQNMKAVAAISLSGPTSRITSSDIEDRIEAVCNIAKEISDNF